MDPVSRVLGERERRRPLYLPWIVAAVLLHAGAAAAVIVAARTDLGSPPQLPAVSVRLVRPQLPARRPATETGARQSRRQPEPQPAPPEPVQQPSPAPRPPVTEPEQPASADAMPAPKSSATPEPRSAPAEPGPPGPPRRGLSVQGGGRSQTGIPADFQFTYYVDRMLALIESRWYKPPLTHECRARVRFTITRTGRLEGITLEESSGTPSFDRAALRALYAANPLPPLPPAYGKSRLTVHLTFSE
jgi:protein TonB